VYALSTATVRIDSSSFVGRSTAIYSNGSYTGDASPKADEADAVEGAAIFVSSSTLSVSGSIFTQLVAALATLVYCDTATVQLVRVFANHGYGGCIVLQSCGCTVVSSTLATHTALYDGGSVKLTASQLSLHDSVVTGNVALSNGGACFGDTSSTVIAASTAFTNNSAAASGGALFMQRNSVVVMAKCVLASNIASLYGGAAFVSDGIMTLSELTITSNVAVDGAGVYISRQSTVHVNTTTFEGNSASKSGGSIALVDYSVLAVNRALFHSNSAQSVGGAIAIVGSSAFGRIATATVNSSEFINNMATQGDGGAVAASGTALVRMYNSTLASNIASQRGGGIFQLGLAAHAEMRECTLWLNTVRARTQPWWFLCTRIVAT
jgi:predicted outer membrane repeat protein